MGNYQSKRPLREEGSSGVHRVWSTMRRHDSTIRLLCEGARLERAASAPLKKLHFAVLARLSQSSKRILPSRGLSPVGVSD
jgi:hypothetical protein